MRRTLLALLAVVAAAVGVSACGGSGSSSGSTESASAPSTSSSSGSTAAATTDNTTVDGKGKTIGLVIPDISNEQVRLYKDGAQAAADAAGAELLTTSTYDSAKQLSGVETYISRHVDGLVLGVNDPKAVVPAVKKANKEGIPVAAVTTKPPAGELVNFSGYDLGAMGEMVGTWMAKKLGSGTPIGIVEGLPSDAAGAALVDGFKKTAVPGGLKVVASQPGNWDRSTSLQVATDMLTAHPEIKGIFAANDDEGLGVVQAAASRGRTDLVVAGIQGRCDALNSIIGGKLDYTAMFFNDILGKTATEQVLNSIAGKPTTATFTAPLIGVDQDFAKGLLSGSIAPTKPGYAETLSRLKVAQGGCN